MPRLSWPFHSKVSSSTMMSTSVTGTSYSWVEGVGASQEKGRPPPPCGCEGLLHWGCRGAGWQGVSANLAGSVCYILPIV